MVIILFLSLITVRFLLNALGVIDFGINNVVGGIVTMFIFLNYTMTNATQRFFSYELGKESNGNKITEVFHVIIIIFTVMCFIILLISQTIGLWFVMTKINIPENRMKIIPWVYQCSIFSFVFLIIRTPFTAILIAYEDMKTYSILSILDAVLKFASVIILFVYKYDKLKFFSILNLFVTFSVSFIFCIYVKYKFLHRKVKFNFNYQLFKKLLSYTSWSLFGNIAAVFKNQGVNILLNVFFDPIVNAGRAIAYQVNSAILNFTSNLTLAVKPPLIKAYASNNTKRFMFLIYNSSRLNYFLMIIVSIPLLFETKLIFKIWLKNVPDYAVLFSRLIIIDSMVECITQPLIIAAQATGKIKKYQITLGCILILNLPISYLLLKLDFGPEIAMIVGIFLTLIACVARIILIKELINLSILKFIREVVLYALSATVISICCAHFVSYILKFGIFRLIILSLINILLNTISFFYLGNNKQQRIKILNKMKTTWRKYV